MKRKNFFSKAMILLLTVSMSIFIFAGCQSKDNNSGSEQTTSSSTQNSNKPNPEEMKKRMQDNIKSLVSDGTITQVQADKIVEALSTNTRKKGANGSSQNNGQGKTGSDQKSDNQQDKSQENKQNNNNNGQNKPRNNALNKLVSDGVITQAQADAVMKKIGGNFNRKNNGQAPQNNNQTSQQQ